MASATRIKALPDVPTVAEFGYKDYEVSIWTGLFAPAKTPSATIAELARLFVPAVQAPDVQEKLDVQGMYPMVTCGAESAPFYESSMTTTSGSFARRTSRRSDETPARDISGHKGEHEARDDNSI